MTAYGLRHVAESRVKNIRGSISALPKKRVEAWDGLTRLFNVATARQRKTSIEDFGHVPQRVRDAREGLLVAVRAAHAAADVEVVARDHAGGVGYDDDAQVVREDVDRVVPRHRDADLGEAGGGRCGKGANKSEGHQKPGRE